MLWCDLFYSQLMENFEIQSCHLTYTLLSLGRGLLKSLYGHYILFPVFLFCKEITRYVS